MYIPVVTGAVHDGVEAYIGEPVLRLSWLNTGGTPQVMLPAAPETVHNLWYATEQKHLVWYGTVRHGMVRYCSGLLLIEFSVTVRCGTVQHILVPCGMVRYGTFWIRILLSI